MSAELAFIERLAPIVRGVPGISPAMVVVVMAQAIQESGYGTSELAVQAHNLFGAAADLGDHDQWALPERYTLARNWERVNGTDQYGPREFYRYPDDAASVRSHVALIMGATGIKAYQERPIPDDSKALAAWLCTAPRAYATDETYVSSLVALIDRWSLSSYAPDPERIDPMATSQNGWAVIPDYGDATLHPLPAITGAVRTGDVWTIFNWLAGRYDREVEPIRRAESWGYAPRKIAGTTVISNHASGTAVDFNSDLHPQHGRTMTTPQIQACRAIVASSRIGEVPVLRWGGDYPASQRDEMHWEIGLQRDGVSPAMVSELAARIRGGVQSAAASLISKWTHRVVDAPESDPLNVRSSPSLGNNIITTVTTGARLRIDGYGPDNWVHVVFEDDSDDGEGSVGWVSNLYITRDPA